MSNQVILQSDEDLSAQLKPVLEAVGIEFSEAEVSSIEGAEAVQLLLQTAAFTVPSVSAIIAAKLASKSSVYIIQDGVPKEVKDIEELKALATRESTE